MGTLKWKTKYPFNKISILSKKLLISKKKGVYSIKSALEVTRCPDQVVCIHVDPCGYFHEVLSEPPAPIPTIHHLILVKIPLIGEEPAKAKLLRIVELYTYPHKLHYSSSVQFHSETL